MQESSSRRYLRYALLLLLLTGCAAAPLPGGGGWTTYLYNDSRSNVSPEKVAVPMTVSWSRDVSDFRLLRAVPKEELSSPLVSGGLLYAGSADHWVYAMDLATGKITWKFDAGYPVEAPPASGEGLLCFGSGDGILRCFAEGKQLWQFQARSEILSSPVIRGGMVYFSSSDDRVYGLNARTGEKAWSYTKGTYSTVTPRVYSSPAYSEASKRLFVSFSDGSIVCLHAETGKEAWAKKAFKGPDLSWQTRRTPLVEGGMVYVIDENRAVVALSEDTGETKGVYNPVKAQDFIVPDNKTIVIAGEDQVAAVDRLTGAVLWKSAVSLGRVSTIFASNDLLFVLSNHKKAILGFSFLTRDKGHIEALGIKDGKTVWSSGLASSVTSGAAAGNGRVAMLTNSGVIEVFGPKR